MSEGFGFNWKLNIIGLFPTENHHRRIIVVKKRIFSNFEIHSQSKFSINTFDLIHFLFLKKDYLLGLNKGTLSWICMWNILFVVDDEISLTLNMIKSTLPHLIMCVGPKYRNQVSVATNATMLIQHCWIAVEHRCEW